MQIKETYPSRMSFLPWQKSKPWKHTVDRLALKRVPEIEACGHHMLDNHFLRLLHYITYYFQAGHS